MKFCVVTHVSHSLDEYTYTYHIKGGLFHIKNAAV